jgi:hypothetical protein
MVLILKINIPSSIINDNYTYLDTVSDYVKPIS